MAAQLLTPVVNCEQETDLKSRIHCERWFLANSNEGISEAFQHHFQKSLASHLHYQVECVFFILGCRLVL